MKVIYNILFLGFALNLSANNVPVEKSIVVITASYKNAKWYKWNLNMVFDQKYDNWHMIYIDDCSPDGTGELVKSYVKQKGYEDKITLISNANRRGAMENQYLAIHHFCKPTDIVIILDGDDWFAHDQVLSYINNVYADGTTWLTYGQFREFPSGSIGFCSPMPQEIVACNAFRQFEHIPSHLRTFYAGLFHKIKLQDLMYDGIFFPMAPDMAAMIPMIEMACDHFRFIPDVLLEYNAINPISEHRISVELQKACDVRIRSMKAYEKIESPF